MRLCNFSDKKNKNGEFIILNICVILLCMLVALIFCAKKQGFHEDEYYSYYSSNRTDGFWVEDSTLMDRQTILNEFSVVPGEGFNFSLVKEVQSWDVHPPVYYFLLHFICSLMPGVFSMWQGLVLNLLALLVCLVLLKWLGSLVLPEFPFLTTGLIAAWGVSAATLTGVVFIRMYMLLTVWILAITILHAKEYFRRIEDNNRSKTQEYSFYLILAVITFLGFMTHYYFFIWLFFLAVCFNLDELIRTRKILHVIKYLITMVISFGLSYVFYPAWPAQMFRGQRGAQATGNFFDFSNTWSRICFFADKVNRLGFGRTLPLVLLLIIGCAAVRFVICKKNNDAKSLKEIAGLKEVRLLVMLLIASLCYFLVVSKTALMLGDSSIRYQMPILGVSYVAVIGLCAYIWDKGVFIKFSYAVLALIVACNTYTIVTGSVCFLYDEEAEHAKLLDEYKDACVVYVFNPDSSQTWCIWDSTEEFLRSEFVYFSAGDKLGEISETDRDLMGKYNQMVVYVDNGVEKSDVLHKITAVNPNISTMAPLYSHQFCDVFLCE